MKSWIRYLSLLLSLLCLTAAFSACGGGETGEDDTTGAPSGSTTGGGDEQPAAENGLLVNIDINSVTFPFFAELGKKETLTEADLYPMVDAYVGTQVTDLLFNVFCQFSATPSDIMTDAVERHNELNSTEENPCWNLKHLAKMYEVYDIDPYEVWFKRTREQGLKAWLSVRMNDCHDPDKYDSWLHGDLFYEANEKGWTIGPSYGYFRYCLDYSEEAIRRYMLDYIKEQLMRYDVDGIELDFSREMYCFDLKDGKDHVAIMNQFMRDVAAIVKEAEGKWDHNIDVTIRLMRDIEQNKAFGFDAETMVSEKLVDSITICPRWNSNDTDMPLDEWKEAFPETPIYVGLEPPMDTQLATLTAGMAHQYLRAGADKIYLFNYFVNPLNPDSRYVKIFNSCGSLETLNDAPRRHMVGYQDIAPTGYTPWKPLPDYADGFEIDIPTGPVEEGDKVWVLISVSEKIKKGDLTITMNGHELTFKSMTTLHKTIGGGDKFYHYRYTVSAEFFTDDIQHLVFSTENPLLTVNHIEITVGVNIG